MPQVKQEETVRIVRGLLSLGRRLRAARPPGSVSLSAIAVLAALWRLGPVPAVRLAAEEQLQPQSLTRLIAALERDGLISRTPSEADRRVILIDLTREGADVLAADMRVRRDWLDQAMRAVLADDERDILFKASRVMLKLAGHDDNAATSIDEARGSGGRKGRRS